MNLTLGNVAPDAPLRLSIAAKLAFPDGSMTASGLRREAARGRLRIWRIAGKDFTTLNEIKRMMELCRVPAKEAGIESSPSNTSVPSGPEAVVSAQDALRARLKQSRLQEQIKR
ncbi:hypothetical protein BSZ21_05345 [Bradyrhizobium canariense]|nr:hypothetical protein BSZ21_05345 [Bradyrhizobium canariense]